MPKPALFLIFVFVLLFLFQINSNKAVAQAQKVSVSAFVDEHLTFQKSSRQLLISTNTPNRYILISSDGLPLGYLNGPQETRIDINDSSFILVAEF